MNHKQIKELIKDMLKKMDMYSDEALELVYLTGLVESNYDYISQLGSGIARSFWQVETSTAKDTIDNYLVYRKDKLKRMAYIMNITPERLESISSQDLKCLLWTNIAAGIVFCRLKYWRVPNPIPADLKGKASYWKQYYNTQGGAGTTSHFLEIAKKRKD